MFTQFHHTTNDNNIIFYSVQGTDRRRDDSCRYSAVCIILLCVLRIFHSYDYSYTRLHSPDRRNSILYPKSPIVLIHLIFFFFFYCRQDFYDEVESLWKIRDPNITRVVGCCLSEEPFCLVTEFMQYGDLNQFLQEHVAVTAAPVPPYAKTLRFQNIFITDKKM